MKLTPKKLILNASAALIILSFGSCNKSNGWSVDGTVEGAPGQKIALEQNISGAWVLLDSLEIDNNGNFAYTADSAAGFPDLYRLTFNGSQLYFPVDSLDHITIKTTADDFGGRYQMQGSSAAQGIAQANQLIYHYIDSLGLDNALNDRNLKVSLFNLFRDGDDVMTPYYLIYRNIGGHPLYDIVNRDIDFRMLGAVATKFKQQRPDDPRSKYLENIYLQEQRRRNPVTSEISAEIIGAPQDIISIDTNGQQKSLFELLDSGSPIILSFARYSDDATKAYTMALNSIYDKYASNGLQIYQVSVDPEESDWLQMGRNLRWISVWGPAIKNGNPLITYNVAATPMTYIFDKNGNLAERIVDWSELDQAVAKQF